MSAISLFSGCGGDTLGLERAGFKVIAFNEFKKPAIDTHLLNFPESTLIEDKSKNNDITKIPDEVFVTYKNKVDIVFAGFPCQGFSNAGKRKATDPRNQMYRQFVRFVKNSQPKFFIGENVTGLTTMKSGPKESDPSMLALIESAFNEIGYSMTYQVLEATDFGVPQKRKRILLVGWRRDLFPSFNTESFWAQVAANGAAKVAPKLRTFVTTSMDGAFKVPSAQVPHDFALYARPVAQNAEPVGTPHPYVSLKAGTTSEEYDGKTHTSLLSCSKRDSPIHSEVVDLDAPSKTIICTYEHQPRLLVGLRKPDGTAYVRALLPDELKQIQGFPKNFKLCGNLKEQIVQVGNAVPPAFVCSVAKALRNLD
jgi:DNA (cytosine-5)-methyltransferase 1